MGGKHEGGKQKDEPFVPKKPAPVQGDKKGGGDGQHAGGGRK